MTDSTDPYSQTREAVETALARAVSEMEQAAAGYGPGDEAAYRQASWLTETCREATIASGRLRAALIVRVQEGAGLSLSALGQKLGISKARADDLVRSAQGRTKGRKRP